MQDKEKFAKNYVSTHANPIYGIKYEVGLISLKKKNFVRVLGMYHMEYFSDVLSNVLSVFSDY